MISVVVLAAGTASRFGSTKQLARLRGRPLVQYPLDAAAEAGVDEIVVVLGHDADAVAAALDLPPNARTVRNPRYAQGQSTSVAAGLDACASASDAAIVLLADQPGIHAEHVGALVSAFGETGGPILRLRFRGGPGPALIARPLWPEVIASIGADAGARTFFDAHPDRVAWVAVDEDLPPDVDEPADLPEP